MESAGYLFDALDNRSFLAHVFDVQRNDFGLYQARELSYALDRLDGLAVAATFIASGRFAAVSWWHLLAVALIAMITVRSLRQRAPALGVAVTLLPAALLVSSPSVVLAARHFRTAKALAALALCVLSWQLVRLACDRRESERTSPRELVAAFGAAIVLILADRQGTFFVVGMALLLALVRDARRIVLALVLAVAGGLAYNVLIGPLLIRQFAGQEVNWALQSGTLSLTDLGSLDAWRGGATWMLDSLNLFAGSFGLAWGAVVAGAAVVLAWRVGGRGWGVRTAAALVALLVFGTLMKVRHPPLDAPEVRIGYYNLPLHALMTVGVALILSRLAGSPGWPAMRRRVALAGFTLVALNVAASPRLAMRVRAGQHASELPVSAALVTCIERAGDSEAERALATAASRIGWGGRYVRLCARYRALR